jgi:GntR family transcriptional regulator, transcriptional repressor for pyruvate dehydrogenase complex
MGESTAAVEAVFQPVDPPTTLEQTVERLGTAVRLGLLPPGTRLPPERDLAERLEISRSTLRQALTTLVASGHLVAVRGRTGGTFVADAPPLTDHSRASLGGEAATLLDYRLAVEAGAAVLAAERAEPSQLDLLDALVDRMAEITDFETFRRADVRFHIGIADAAHSPRLVAEMTEVQGRVSEMICRMPPPDHLFRRANEQHLELVRCLRARDAAQAVHVVREHIRATERILAEPPVAVPV